MQSNQGQAHVSSAVQPGTTPSRKAGGLLTLPRRLLSAKPLSPLNAHRIAGAILVSRLLLGAFYSIAIPIWEAYDEPGHYQYAHYVRTQHTLPQAGDPAAEEIEERMQPPLYYVLGALAISPIHTSDDLAPQLNPFFPTGTGGVNYAIHPDSESFPYRGTVLAVHVLRLLSVALSLVGIACTYLIGLTIAPARREIALGAMAIHAFWPQFLFSGSVVTNDVLAGAIGSAILLVLMRMVRARAAAWQALTLGALFGLGLLSKLNTVALLPVAILVVIKAAISSVRYSSMPQRLAWCLQALAGGVVLLAAWAILQQMTYVVIPVLGYGQSPLSAEALRAAMRSLAGLDLATVRAAVAHTLYTFFATFGWGNIAVESLLYDVYAVLLIVATAGLALFFVRRRSEPTPASVAVLLAQFLAVLILPLLLVPAHGQEVSFAPGRYLLPGLSAFSVLLYVGCDEVSRFRKTSPLPAVVVAALALFAVVIPFRYIRPAYARPPLLSLADVEHLENPVALNFGDKIQLLGYEVETSHARPRRPAAIALYWRSLKEMDRDYAVCVRLIGPEGEPYPADCTYPQRGNYATSLWKRGDIFKDTYYGRVPRDVPAPSVASINVAIFTYPEEEYLPALDAQGALIGESVTFGRVKVASSEKFDPDIPHSLAYYLGDSIALIGYGLEGTSRPGDTLTLRLYWSPLAAIGQDYTVFVHLMDRDGRLWAQHDGQTRNDTYPTGLWDEGEVIEDERRLTLPADLPAGTYEIRVGMYSLETMQRLPAVDDGGERQPDDAIVLTEIAIAPDSNP